MDRTRGFRGFKSCAGRGSDRPQENNFKHLPAGPVGSRPVGLGFMSTQRRESHRRPVRCMDCAGTPGEFVPASFARQFHAHAGGQTARPTCSAQLATNSLQSDRRTRPLLRLVPVDYRSGFPRLPVAVSAAFSRSSLPPIIPSPPGLAHFHPALPWLPVVLSHRTERYDGKRDMHFQHAA